MTDRHVDADLMKRRSTFPCTHRSPRMVYLAQVDRSTPCQAVRGGTRVGETKLLCAVCKAFFHLPAFTIIAFEAAGLRRARRCSWRSAGARRINAAAEGRGRTYITNSFLIFDRSQPTRFTMVQTGHRKAQLDDLRERRGRGDARPTVGAGTAGGRARFYQHLRRSKTHDNAGRHTFVGAWRTRMPTTPRPLRTPREVLSRSGPDGLRT